MTILRRSREGGNPGSSVLRHWVPAFAGTTRILRTLSPISAIVSRLFSQDSRDQIMTKWQFQEARNQLSEVVRKASDEGPQVITLRGDDAVVVAADEYARITRKPKGTLVDFLRKSPLAAVALDLRRSRDTAGRVEL